MSRYYFDYNLDSTLYYADSSYNTALHLTGLEKKEASINMADAFFEKGDFEKAQTYLDTAQIIVSKYNIKHSKAIFYNLQASIFFHSGDTERGLVEFQKALDYAILENDQHSQNNIIVNIADLHYTLLNFDKAIEYYQKGLNNCEKK